MYEFTYETSIFVVAICCPIVLPESVEGKVKVSVSAQVGVIVHPVAVQQPLLGCCV